MCLSIRLRRVSALLASLSLLSGVTLGSEDVDFNRDIRPILSDRCFPCHGPDERNREADLRLDLPDDELGAYRTRDEVTVIRPGDVEGSELWHRITSDDAFYAMPPSSSHKKRLSAEQIALFKKWIESGAKYDRFWAFVPPREKTPPEVDHASWREGLVDPWVMAKLEAKGLEPKPEADRRTLIRRLSFDLTGLPPTPGEIQRFLEDDSPSAYERLVDRLLAKPAFGEHVARYWADLVRLADTAGMHKDFPRDFSEYRAWLIRSFNDNLPYDDFVRYQLAGDLFDDPTQDQLVASGFNRLHLIIDKGTALPEESFHKNVLDRVQAFGTAFLGLTVQCAQCHDHKFDPIRQRDFYRFYAFFNNFDGEPETDGSPPRGMQPPFIYLADEKQEAERAKLREQEAKLAEALAVLQAEADAQRAEDLKKRLEGARSERSRFEGTLPVAMVMKERPDVRETHLLIRGAYDAPGEVVERGTPSFLPPMPEKDGAPTRRDLAEWLVAPGHPLTARVAVNRFWQQLIGVGLVKTSEDFGAQGEWPSHPELLDALAVRFIDSGWNVKQLFRDIVCSKTYRQSSNATPAEHARDPENRLLARGSRYRLDAEVLRDQILFVSGLLNREMYGRSVKPPQPPGLWEAVSMAHPLTYVADEGEAIYRRSFYSYWRRAIPPPQMTILNAPSREYCTARRERTNTPLQALLLMNEPEWLQATRSCAQATLAETGGDESRTLSRLFEKITSQRLDSAEEKLLERSLQEFRLLYGAMPEEAEALTRGLDAQTAEERVELAAWTMITHSLLNTELAKVRR
ncbi:MAG: PSD1 and planctomycete cytochrome C domain-containing protein [Planctomycetota bacterium]